VTSWVNTNQVGNAELKQVQGVVSHAIDIYSNLLIGPRPVRLKITFEDQGGTTCATGAPEWSRTVPGLPGIWWPSPLACQLANVDIPAAPAWHAHIEINSRMVNQHDYDYSLTPDVPGGKIDFLHVMLHELGHCMGFVNLCNDDGSWHDGTSDLHSWSLWYEDFFGDYVQFVFLNQAERYVALESDALYWWDDYVEASCGGPFQVYAPFFGPALPENNASHWDPSHSPNELMEPTVTRNLRDLGMLSPALRDLGWTVVSVAFMPHRVHLFWRATKSGASQPVYITNNRSVTTSIDLSITGPHALEFTATSAPGTINLAPYQTYTVTVSGAPSSLGYKTATLHAEYNDGTAQVVEVALSMFAIGVDTDGDGISDGNESSPFDPLVADSTGEDGFVGADGVDDGYNDFDGDGMTNAEELIFGYDPFDPNSFGVLTEFDTDGDGISDEDETRDLDPETPGTQNPFDPYLGDSTGNHPNEDIPDGIPDGQNDYDGDGLSNSEEFIAGSNPLDPTSPPQLPVSSRTATGIAMVILLCFGGSCLYRVRRRKV